MRFGLSRGARILIGDEMGLGKTVQAVALLAAYRDKWPALIVTPASLRGGVCKPVGNEHPEGCRFLRSPSQHAICASPLLLVKA